MTKKIIRRVSDLLPDKKNANKGTERGRNLLEHSLRTYGTGRSILVDKNGAIIAGNKTAEESVDVGLEDIILVESDGKKLVVVQRTDLDLNKDKSARELAIADNRVSELDLDWDASMMKDIDLSTVGFSEKEQRELMRSLDANDSATPDARMDEADALRKQWKTATGQLWVIESESGNGAHRLLVGDSSKQEAVARLFGKDKASLMATDPPYGVAYGIETGVDSKHGAMANDENDGPRLQAFLERVFKACEKHLVEDAAWYLWHAQMTQGFFAAAAAAADVVIHRQIIWVKPSLVLGHGDYHWRHELCFYGWRKGHRPRWMGDRKQTTVWEVGREHDGLHPTQKPVELFQKPMGFNTMKGEIVYEPFAGSGTQFVAAEQMARRCYGIEVEPKYAAVVLQRLSQMGLHPKLGKR